MIIGINKVIQRAVKAVVKCPFIVYKVVRSRLNPNNNNNNDNMENRKDVEHLLKRIDVLEDAHARLRQHIFISRNHHTSEAHYLNILQSIDALIHISDHRGCLIYGNPAWEKFYGYTVAECQGKNTLDLIIRHTDATIANNILQQILNGAIHAGEFVVRNKKGERFLTFGTTNPLRDENGRIIGLISISSFPKPFPEISPQLQVDAPHQPSLSDLATKLNSKTHAQEFSSIVLSPEAEWMVKNEFFHSPATPSCWHWLYHSDQQHEYALKMISCMPPRTSFGQWSCSFDKVYEIKWEDLMIRGCLGKGSCWILYRAVWYGSDVALKLFPRQESSHAWIHSFGQEVSVMRRLRHPNILLFMGVVISPHHACIVTEFLCRGSLFQLLHLRRVRFNLKHRVHIALDIARGMNYLHCCLPPIIHCDLKSANLRVDKNWTVKIGDFGLCRPKHETKEGIGTPEWMAPEVLRNEEANEKSDVYSYGVVLWEMTTGKVPWHGHSSIQVIKAVGLMKQRLDVPKDVDPEWASLIERCLYSEAESRPTFQEILDELKELQKNIALHVTKC